MSNHDVLRRLSSTNLSRNKSHESVDSRAHSSEGGSHLYRYGHEIIPSSLSNSLPPLGAQESLYPQNDYVKSSEDESIFSQISSLSKIKPKTLKVVSGSQFRLTTKSWTQCEQCEIFDRTNKKSKETIRTLKLQLARLEESFRDLKYSRALEQSLVDVKASADSDQKGIESGVPSRKVERLEEEVLKLKKLVSFERSASEALRQSLEESQQSHSNEISSLRQEMEKVLGLKNNFENENHRLLSQIHMIQIERDSLLSELESNNRASLSRQNSEEIYAVEIHRLTEESAKLDAQNKNLQTVIQQKQALITQQESKIASLDSTISQLEDKVASCQNEILTLTTSLKASQDQTATFRKRCEALENSLKTTNQEKDSLKLTLADKENIINEKNKKIDSLEAEIRNQTSKMSDLLKRIALESETTKKALEKSIASSVRLCVVAPTVNVHVNEGRTKFKSK
eukprot:CAMPEP_0173145542 /NCGR_PEP_ID=MMETSP1105-20130129/7932_1 /TAXON_ID=2985 /ORGANISM="Ochromonas sp., Strain BG-1" /LENGTH=454 /DNA_ID=CAMNT_0014059517 /DNA_START=21 /DNA_END=1385 /DNA_ORIENTATION=-